MKKFKINTWLYKAVRIQNNFLSNIPDFSRAKLGPFFQELPVLNNQFVSDVTLTSYLQRVMGKEIYMSVQPDLVNFGKQVVSNIQTLHMNLHEGSPQLRAFNAWGNRIDEIIMPTAWQQMKELSAIEGLVAIPYENKWREFSRLYQVSKLYLFSPSAGLYTCPLAMTDGAAKTINNMKKSTDIFTSTFDSLTSRNPLKFLTSGQWMTERKGGSDVANGTETIAESLGNDTYKLFGYKWFTSAIDADVAFTLARITNEGAITTGSKGLSMFFVKVRNEDGKLNNIEVVRLKDKLGTRQMPTAELLLDGTIAFLASDKGRGVAAISDMLSITRLHNAVSAVAAMRRIVNLAKDYSTKRFCFGSKIMDFPLHTKTLFKLELECRGGLLMVLEIARLLGLEENKKISETEINILRLLTPIAKLYTAKQAMSVVSEGLECFGGIGYLEDSGLPLILRDAQVLPIWEGTTNILSLDVLRAIAKSNGKVLIFLNSYIKEKLEEINNAISDQRIKDVSIKLISSMDGILNFVLTNQTVLEVSARDLSYSIARTYIGFLMLEHAISSDNKEEDIFVAISWCSKDLTPVLSRHSLNQFSKEQIMAERNILFNN